MTGLLLRLAISALGLWVAAQIVPGMHVASTGTLLLAALLLGLVNAVVRPLLILFTLPLTMLTLGLFLLVVNGLMLLLVASMLDGFVLDGLLSAVLAWLVSSAIGLIANGLIGPHGRIEIIVVDRRG